MFNLDSNSVKLILQVLYEICGINLSSSKQVMIQNRINSLMKSPMLAHISNINELVNSVKSNSQVRQAFINSFTTNKTDLFRESYHFDDMIDRSLMTLLKKNHSIKILCSASSSGEEPYSIAATCLYAKNLYKSSSFIKIIATDIDTNMLELAKKGEYYLDFNLNKIPHWVDLNKYFEVTKQAGSNNLELKARPILKNMITFKQLNLFDKSYNFTNLEFDIIFCRNVLIYFKNSDQEQILNKLFELLKVDGTLYLGHSEDAIGLSQKVQRLGNKIFYKL